MSTLAELVAGKTLAEARAYLDQLVTVPNPEPIDSTKLMARLDPTDANEVLATLKGVAASDHPLKHLVGEAYTQVQGKGIDLSHVHSRTMIDALFAGNPTLAAKLKALGEKQVTRAEANGLGRVKDGHILEVL